MELIEKLENIFSEWISADYSWLLLSFIIVFVLVLLLAGGILLFSILHVKKIEKTMRTLEAESLVMSDNIVAKFNPMYRPYLVLSIGFYLIKSIIGIPLALLWFLGIGQWWARHYFDKLELHLGERSLRFRKGIIFHVEKTIPLENIQDVTFIEGPLLKRFHLAILKFETAGQSAGQAHDMRFTGIINANNFRSLILAKRDKLRYSEKATDQKSNDQTELLKAILHQLEELTRLMQSRG